MSRSPYVRLWEGTQLARRCIKEAARGTLRTVGKVEMKLAGNRPQTANSGLMFYAADFAEI
jgi:hypothetical protein